MKLRIVIVCSCIVWFGLSAPLLSLGQVQTSITFDDLPELAIEPITNGYFGLQWNNFHLMGGGAYEGLPTDDVRGFGYRLGIVSPKNVAFNPWGSPAELSSLTPFYALSGYFTAAYSVGLQLRVQGFLTDAQVYESTFTLDPFGPRLLTFNTPIIDRLRFVSSGGVSYYGFAYGDHFAMDDMQIALVPEPTVATLLFVTVFLFGLFSRQQKGTRTSVR